MPDPMPTNLPPSGTNMPQNPGMPAPPQYNMNTAPWASMANPYPGPSPMSYRALNAMGQAAGTQSPGFMYQGMSPMPYGPPPPPPNMGGKGNPMSSMPPPSSYQGLTPGLNSGVTRPPMNPGKPSGISAAMGAQPPSGGQPSQAAARPPSEPGIQLPSKPPGQAQAGGSESPVGTKPANIDPFPPERQPIDPGGEMPTPEGPSSTDRTALMHDILMRMMGRGRGPGR